MDEVDGRIVADLLVMARSGLLLALVEVGDNICLAHLARVVAAKVVHEHDVARLLVAGDEALAVRLHLGGREVRPRQRLNHRRHRLPHHRIARAEHEAVVDGGVRAQHVLHLGHEHIFAAGLDHVLLARAHVEVPVRVPLHEVARAQPAAGREHGVGQVGLPVVALHGRIRPEQRLSHLAVRQLVARLVHHLHLDVLHRPPHALEQRGIGRQHRARDAQARARTAFRLPPPVVEHSVGELVVDGLDDGLRGSARRALHEAHRAQIVLVDGGTAQQAQVGGRRQQDHMRHAIAVDATQYLLRVERLADNERRASRQGDREPAVPAVMLKRALDEHDGIGLVANAVGIHDGIEFHQVGGVRAGRALRQPGRAARVLNAGQGTRIAHQLGFVRALRLARAIKRNKGRIEASDGIAPHPSPRIHADKRHRARKRTRRLGHRRGELRCEHERSRPARIHKVADLARNELVVQRDGHGPDLLDGIVHLQDLGAVRQQICHAVARAHAHIVGKQVRDPIDAGVQLAVGRLVAVEHHRDLVGMRAHAFQKRLGNVAVSHANPLRNLGANGRTAPWRRRRPSS